jgi:hypothetical protein
MEEPSRDARRASPDPVLVVDVNRHAGIPRAMLKIEIAPASVQPISACRITHREGGGRGEVEGDLEEVPRDGETREAGAEDGVAQGAVAVPSCGRRRRRRRGRGGGGRGGGSDSSPGEQTGRS